MASLAAGWPFETVFGTLVCLLMGFESLLGSVNGRQGVMEEGLRGRFTPCLAGSQGLKLGLVLLTNVRGRKVTLEMRPRGWRDRGVLFA